jgi:hypothetical protein
LNVGQPLPPELEPLLPEPELLPELPLPELELLPDPEPLPLELEPLPLELELPASLSIEGLPGVPLEQP